MTVMQNETLGNYCKLANTMKVYQRYKVDLSCENSFCPHVIGSFNYTEKFGAVATRAQFFENIREDQTLDIWEKHYRRYVK